MEIMEEAALCLCPYILKLPSYTHEAQLTDCSATLSQQLQSKGALAFQRLGPQVPRSAWMHRKAAGCSQTCRPVLFWTFHLMSDVENVPAAVFKPCSKKKKSHWSYTSLSLHFIRHYYHQNHCKSFHTHFLAKPYFQQSIMVITRWHSRPMFTFSEHISSTDNRVLNNLLHSCAGKPIHYR